MSLARDLSRIPLEGADIIPHNRAANYAPGTLGASVNQIFGQIPINPLDYHDGGDDYTDAVAAAILVSRQTGRSIFFATTLAIYGTLDPAGATFVGINQYGRENVDPDDWGAVLEHRNPDGPLFAPTGGGWVLDGVVLYDPLQPGGDPVARPPMVDIGSPYHAVDVTIQNCVVVNAYDFIHSAAGSTCGDWRVSNNRGYAIRYLYNFEGPVPEVILSEGNVWSWGVWQAGGAVGSYALAKWTGLNGAYLRWNTAGTSVDGFKSSNEIVFGYKNVLRGIAGLLNVSTISNMSMDQCVQPIYTEGDAGIDATISGKVVAIAYGNAATNLPAIKLGGAGVYKLTMDLQGQMAAGKWLDMVMSGTGYVTMKGDYEHWGSATGAANVNFADIQAGALHFILDAGLIEAAATDQVGLNIADIKTYHGRATFSKLNRALQIGTCPSAQRLRDASLVTETVSSNSYTNSAGAAFVAAGTYDKP